MIKKMNAFGTGDVTIFESGTNITFLIKKRPKAAMAELNRIETGWYFSRLFVPKEIRGQGLASALVDHVVAWACENDYSVLCEVNAYGDMTHDQLVDFYVRHGFTDHGNYLAIGDVVIGRDAPAAFGID